MPTPQGAMRWAQPAEGVIHLQAQAYVGSAIYANGIRNCGIENNVLAHLGTWGIELWRGCKHNHIAGNHLYDIGAGGIKIGEPLNAETDELESIRVFLSLCMNAAAAPAIAGKNAEAWTVSTDDTQLTIGATANGQLRIYELSNPATGWNWETEPSVFDLMGTVSVDGRSRDVRWNYRDGSLDETDGRKVTIRFDCDSDWS